MSDLPAFLRERAPAPRAAPPPIADGGAPDRATSRRTPGEAGLWILLLGDMTVFALLFGAFLLARADDPVAFAAARQDLTPLLGAANTVVLLTSSLFVARATASFRAGQSSAAARGLRLAALMGLVFVLLKAVEWGVLIDEGNTPASSDFLMFYFVITGVHFLHLVVGAGALGVALRAVRRPHPMARDALVVECATCYWHMVDLLWIVIFPLLYFSAT